MSELTYQSVGVDYSTMDPFKKAAQLAAQETRKTMERFGFNELEWSRGESAYLFHTPIGTFAHVEEGLGTKNLVADTVSLFTRKSHYNQIAQCTVAMIVNDMATLNVMPVSIAMHLAVGNSDWFKNEERSKDLVEGWAKACTLARCVWGGGETPTLKDIVIPGTVSLSGSGVGFSKKIIQPKVSPGDAIILLESSGIHANGLTLARKIADTLPNSYMTRLSDGTTYGESLLSPTNIYVGAIEDLINAGKTINYAVNITGHGWRKLMRLKEPFTYRIKDLFPDIPIFNFIQKKGNVTDEEAYGNLNMGAGFAIYVPKHEAESIVEFVNKGGYGFNALNAGNIETGPKQVVIEPKNLIFKGETLDVR
jgi:phosphoribosylformylglycinamidine cyclo-ligase